MQTISFKWVVKGGHIEGISAFMNPYLYLIDRDPKSKWDGWETRKIDYGLRDIYVTIRAKEVDYDKEEIRVIYGKFMPVVYRVNCAMDSVTGTLKDFAKQFIMQVED